MTNRELIAKPFTFKIEFTRGCNIKCSFCPIAILPAYSANKEYLTPQLAMRIAGELYTLNDRPRIELTMRGEPTLNPWFLNNVRILREFIPHAQISLFTNGIRCLSEPSLIRDSLDAGVNIFNIDCYNNTYLRFENLVKGLQKDFELKDFRKFSAYKRHDRGWLLRVVNLVPDIADDAHLVNVREVHNMAGNIDPKALEKFGLKPLEQPIKKNCARPYREAVTTVDGKMLICCHDWKTEGIMGDLVTQSAEEIWYGDTHLAILRSLWAKDRSGPPCFKCDYFGGYRMGFLTNPGAAQ